MRTEVYQESLEFNFFVIIILLHYFRYERLNTVAFSKILLGRLKLQSHNWTSNCCLTVEYIS